MTVRELFDFIKGVRPGFAFNDAQMMVWLNEIEGKVQTDIMLLDPAVNEDGTVTGLVEYDVTTDMNTELIVPFPWNKLYRYFMLMSIDLYNGEFQRYGNSFAQFNEAYEEYAAWYAQNIAPANGLAVAHGYYLTAYQFAVRGGYSGTAQEFYEALGKLGTFKPGSNAATPEDYGAVGDGVTDDTAALQAALDNNPYVYANGTYKVSSVRVYKTTLEIGGEIQGQVIIENYATVRGGRIKANPPETEESPRSSCVKFQNNKIDGYNYMGSTLSDCYLYSDDEAGDGIEIYTWTNEYDIPAPETIESCPIHGIWCKNISIQHCYRSIYFHNNQSWLTKSDFDNIVCLFTSYPIFVENDRSKRTSNVYSLGMYSDITMRNVYAQYGSSKPVNFVRVDKGVIGITMYDCFCYDGIGECYYFINENGGNSRFKLLGTLVNNPAGDKFTNYASTKCFNFTTSMSHGSPIITHSEKKNIMKPWMPTSWFQTFMAYYGPNNTKGKRFSGIISRGGTRLGGGSEKHISGISWHDGHLGLLTNNNDAGIVHSYPDYQSRFLEVATPIGGEVYTSYSDLPADAGNGATCWVRDTRCIVVKWNGYWYKPDGVAYLGTQEEVAAMDTFTDAADLRSKWSAARSVGSAIYKQSINGVDVDPPVYVSFSKNFWYTPETSISTVPFYYDPENTVATCALLPNLVGQSAASVNGTIYFVTDENTCLVYYRRFWRFSDSESHVYYDPNNTASDSAHLPAENVDNGTTYWCEYLTYNTSTGESDPLKSAVVYQDGVWYTPGGSTVNIVEDPDQTGYITDRFIFTQGRAARADKAGTFTDGTASVKYAASELTNIGKYKTIQITVPTLTKKPAVTGYAFYNEKKAYIDGATLPVSESEGVTTIELTRPESIPENAEYIRTTYWKDTYREEKGYDTPFSCYAIRDDEDSGTDDAGTEDGE